MLDPDHFVARCIECLKNGGGSDGIAALTRLALASQLEDPGLWGRKKVLHCSDDLMAIDLTLPPYAQEEEL